MAFYPGYGLTSSVGYLGASYAPSYAPNYGLGLSYAAPVSYAAPLSYPAPVSYAAPVVAPRPAAPAIRGESRIGKLNKYQYCIKCISIYSLSLIFVPI